MYIDIQKFADKPEELLDLIRLVLKELVQIRIDNSGTEVQLVEISKSIARLEKLNQTVPNALRKLKTDMAVELDITKKVDENLRKLDVGFREILLDMGKIIDKQVSSGNSRKKKSIRHKDLPKTPQENFRPHIIKALEDFGGSAKVKDILNRIEEMIGDQLMPGDWELHSGGGAIWRNRAQWERLVMVQEGVLRSDSRRGYWELNGGGA